MSPYRTTPFLLAFALSACGTLGGRPADEYWLKGNVARDATATDSLLAYQAYVWTLPADELARESEKARDAASRDPGEFQRLRVALAAAAPAASAKDHGRATQMLDQIDKDARGSRFAGLLAALRAELAERRRMEDKLRDESRRADDLDRKLGAVKSIEKSLIDRGQPAPVRPK